jgi:hypothetical protein
MKKRIILLIIIGVFVIGITAVSGYINNKVLDGNIPKDDGVYACTMDAKVCPDGSAVGRTGPQCEFQACPGENSDTDSTSLNNDGDGNDGSNGDEPSELIDGVSLESTSQGLVVGTITTSPHCGAQQIPPNPNCGPRGYATQIIATRVGTNDIASQFQTQEDGEFVLSLPVGEYTLHAKGGEVYPRCNDEVVTIIKGESATQDIHCNTGIR